MTRPCCQWSAEKQVRYLKLFHHRTHCYVRLLYIEPRLVGYNRVSVLQTFFTILELSQDDHEKCVFENFYHLSISNLDF